jgi:hypothetical protein
MSGDNSEQLGLAPSSGAIPAQPLWRLAPTRGEDGRCLADFMMLIPGLAARSPVCREQVAAVIREVCESFGDRVAFADINYAINVLWVSVAAEPGLSGQVARAIRQKVPDALLVGGQLGVSSSLQKAAGGGWWRRLRKLSRGASLLLGGPRR